MKVGPCGDSSWAGEATASIQTLSFSRFLFSGVDVVVAENLGALGVLSRSQETLRLVVRLEGVCGAALLERTSRSLLYSLYFCAIVSQYMWQEQPWHQRARLRTYSGIGLDVVAPSFATLVGGCKLLLPCFQINTQSIAALFKFGIAHGEVLILAVV
jgi:hypothetical protein